MLESMCQGNFLAQHHDDAWQFLENLAEKSNQWERSNKKSIYSRSSAHSIGTSFALEAKIDAMIKKFNNVFSSNQMNQASQSMCFKCNDPNHIADQCPNSIEQINAFNKAKNDPFSPTYNPGWRNHPNFAWNQNNPNTNTVRPNFQAFPNNASNPPFQPNHFQPNFAGPSHNQPQQSNFQPNSAHPPQDDKRLSSLEKTLETLAKATTQSLRSNSNLQNLLTSYMQNTNQSIAKFEMQMSQLATSVSERERGKFPSQPLSNPRNQNANSNQALVVQDSNDTTSPN